METQTMSSNFTVIVSSRHHFGDQPGVFNDLEATPPPFVGSQKNFAFDCPNVDPNETAFLTFQSVGGAHNGNIFVVNGIGGFGGLPRGPRNGWRANTVLVEPRHQLRATGNILRVQARDSAGGPGGNIDDFMVDNVVIVYKARNGLLPPITASPQF
jgi:hypothetical protein